MIVLRLIRKCAFPPPGLEPMSRVSVALIAQYLNVRQRKLGTIIIQTSVHILQHDSADTGSVPMKDFLKHNPIKLLPNNPDFRTNGGGGI